MSGWKVGDPVVIRQGRSRGESPVYFGTVEKVARKYFTVRYQPNSERAWVTEDEFEIATGIQRGDPNYIHYRDHAYTPEEWEAVTVRTELLRQLRDHRVPWGFADSTLQESKFEAADLMELIALLDRVKQRTSEGQGGASC